MAAGDSAQVPVPAGKTWVVRDVCLSGGTTGVVNVAIAGATNFVVMPPAGYPVAGSMSHWTGRVVLEAGMSLLVYGSAAADVTITGYELSAA
jgi:hypothetical protein